MDIKDLHEALGKQIANGRGDFEVVVRMGNGKTKPVCGYEVAASAKFDLDGKSVEKEEFRFVTEVLF
jgi:hypothetical protein